METNKTPLSYQISESDCATATLLNAIRYLFNIDEISQDIYKYIVQCTTDRIYGNGVIGSGGTSTESLQYMASWLNQNAKNRGMKMQCDILYGNECSIYNTKLENVIKSGGVAILRVYQTYEHYVLLTKLDDDYAYIFDPYYLDISEYENDDSCENITDKPFEYNRKVLKTRINENSEKDFALVSGKNREIVLINRTY